jgi:secondary thiamine-phosphate synthase enzyme
MHELMNTRRNTMHHHDYILFKTKGELDIKNITDEVNSIVEKSGIKFGTATVFAPGATAAISCIEYEPGLLQDFPDALDRLFPREIDYAHHLHWDDGNGYSHVRATMLGPSLVIPVIDGVLPLGRWQQIIFIDLDKPARDRKVIVQVMGE